MKYSLLAPYLLLLLPVHAAAGDALRELSGLAEGPAAPPAAAAAPAAADRFSFSMLLPETPLSEEYALKAARSPEQADLAGLLRFMAAACLESPRFGSEPVREAKAMLVGVASYLSAGGRRVAFQGRSDRALHFVYAAALRTEYHRITVRLAAAVKEERDAMTPGNYCDYDDYAASMLGLFWAENLAASPEEWLRAAAGGAADIGAVPPLRFGHEPGGVKPSLVRLQEIDARMAAALAPLQPVE